MKPARLRADALAGLTTSFALLPECIAFALVAHLNPLMGLYGAFIICTLTALFGGRPGMVSGAAGSMAVVIVALVVQHGAQYLLATILLGGLIMMAFGLLRLGKLVRMVPHPVMLRVRQRPRHRHRPGSIGAFQKRRKLAERYCAVPDGGSRGADDGHCLPAAAPDPQRAAGLVAILGVGLAVYLLGLPTRTLGDMAHIAGGLPAFALPDIPGTWKPCKSSRPMPW